MRLSNNIIALCSGASLASAKVYDDTVYTGGRPRQHNFNESDLNDLNTPNSTKSVNFMIAGEEWTWRVNITELSVPDARSDLDNVDKPLPDPRIVLSTYDLTWPMANESLNYTAIRFNQRQVRDSPHTVHDSQTSSSNSSTDDPICMSVLSGPTWPNVTNKYQDADSGNCESVLGQACLQAILSENANGRCEIAGFNAAACKGIYYPGRSGRISFCKTATETKHPMIRSQLTTIPPEAASGASYIDRDNFTAYYINYNDPKWNVSEPVQNYGGDGIFFQHGKVSPESNSSAVRQAESQLRMMVLTLPGNWKAAVCMRLDPSIDDEEVSEISKRPNWDGKDSSGDDDSSAASPPFIATVSSVGFVGLALAVFGTL